MSKSENFYAISIDAVKTATDEEVNVWLMANDASWALTRNVGDAFLFFNQEIASDTAKKLSETLKEDDGID